jgi:dTDP-4-amino-4,6-dideoxygalactose transaminase
MRVPRYSRSMQLVVRDLSHPPVRPPPSFYATGIVFLLHLRLKLALTHNLFVDTNVFMSPPRPAESIAFIDLNAQRRRMGEALERAVMDAVHGGQYILGPQVGELEKQLAAFTGAKHAIACGNGTDALALVLMAKGVRPGDAIFVPAFTFVATAEVVAWLGAKPFFVDVRADTFTMDPDSLARAVLDAKTMGLSPKGVIPVDLFGQPADYDAIIPFCAAHDLWVLCDGAQAFGATWHGKRVGTFGLATSTSFFPAKPLGCYGDGGAIFTDDDALAAIIRSLHFHGKGNDRYQNIRIGMNSRLDTIQAAILLEKLAIFPSEIEARQRVADRYHEGLGDVLATPVVAGAAKSVWAQYTLLAKSPEARAPILEACKLAGVPTMIYYPIPLSQQEGYKHYPGVAGGVPVSEDLARRVFSLPMHPYLPEDQQDYIIDVVRKAVAA